MSDVSSKQLGAFRIEKELPGAHGSQGTVYRAVCEEQFGKVAPGTVVALKTMIVQNDREETFARLKNRTEKLMAMEHPNIVRYYGCFQVPDAYSDINVLVLEFLDGDTLKERIARHPKGMDADSVLLIVKAVADALHFASKLGIVHRDVKPGNIFLCSNHAVKVIDFEIAKQEAGTASTTTGGFAGTFNYMAPEFLLPNFRGNVQSDVFSLGVVFHEALTGRLPYTDLDIEGQEMLAFHKRCAMMKEGKSPLAISRRVGELLSRAEETMAKALAVKPEERYHDFEEFAEGVKRIRFRDLVNGNNLYRLIHLIGKGGFGEVYKARMLVRAVDGRYHGDRRDGRTRTVAVKHLADPAYSGRFLREANVLRGLKGPAFVHFVDYFEVKKSGVNAVDSFLVMDYLRGMPGFSLSEVIAAERAKGKHGLPWGDVFGAFAQYAHGLATLHTGGEKPIFHRDIKPANLYYPVGNLSRAAIMDFGIARCDDGQVLTNKFVPGTPDYMPPEAVRRSSRGDAPMDIYALGLSLYLALTGKHAYPRLPKGQAAFKPFLERAQRYDEPTFDDPRVQMDGEVLSLLVGMTRPHYEERLADAAEVERRLRLLAERYRRDLSAVNPPEETPPDQGPGADETRMWEVRSDDPSPLRLDARKTMGVFGWAIGCVIVLLLGVLGFRAWQVYGPSLRPSLPIIKPEPQSNPQSKPEIEKATRRAQTLVADFANETNATPNLVSRQETWEGDWNGKIPSEIFSKLRTDLEVARKKRERADQIKVDVAKAEAEMTGVCAQYKDDRKSLEVADSAFAAWDATWKMKLTDDQLLPMRQKRRVARDERRRKDFIISCKGLLKREPLDERARRLDDLEKMLLDRTKVDCLSSNDVAVIRRNLERERRCFLVNVQNQSGLDIVFESKQLAAPLGVGEARLLALTNGLPAKAVFVSRGYESVPLTKEDADRTRVLKPGDFRPVPVKVELPPLPEGVVCIIDGTNATGEVWLVPGKHKVVWRNLRQTYAGVDDYEPLKTELEVPVDDGKRKLEPQKSPQFSQSEKFRERELKEAKKNVAKLRNQMENKARTICTNAKQNISFDGVSAKRDWLVDYGEARLGREMFDQTKDVREQWSQEIDAVLAEQEKAKQAEQLKKAQEAARKAAEEARKVREKAQNEARKAAEDVCELARDKNKNVAKAKTAWGEWKTKFPMAQIGDDEFKELNDKMERAIGERVRQDADDARRAQMQTQARAACSNICAKVQTRAWNPPTARRELETWTVRYPAKEIGESLQAELKRQMEVCIVQLEQQIEYEEVFAKARFDAKDVVRDFADTNIATRTTERKFNELKIQYGKKLNKEDLQKLTDEVDKARQARLDSDRKEQERLAAEQARIAREAAERERAKQEAALLADVEKLLALEPVTERLGRLDEAERLLAGERAVNCQLKSVRKEEMQKKIDACRRWFVFKLVNRSKLEVSLGDERLKDNEARVFAFTNGLPDELKVQCKGYQPIAAEATWAEKEIPVERLRPLPVRVVVEGLEGDIRGRIGEQVLVDGMELPPGDYMVTWTNGRQTYSGIDDYMPMEKSMRLEVGRPIKLTPPKKWKHTDAFLNVQVNVRVPQLEKTAKCLIDEVSAPGGQVTRIRPGRHRIVFMRADYEDQAHAADIPYSGEEVYNLKGPSAWQPTEALRQLEKARQAFSDGKFNVEDYPACEHLRDPVHQAEWTNMKRQSGNQQKISVLMDDARLYADSGSWANVLGSYGAAIDLGWHPDDDSYEQAKNAWERYCEEYKRLKGIDPGNSRFDPDKLRGKLDESMRKVFEDWKKIDKTYRRSQRK